MDETAIEEHRIDRKIIDKYTYTFIVLESNDMFYWHAYCNFIWFYSEFGTIDPQKGYSISKLYWSKRLHSFLYMSFSCQTTFCIPWAPSHRITPQLHHFHLSSIVLIAMLVSSVQTHGAQHTVQHLCIRIITFPFRIRIFSIYERDWWLHDLPKNDKNTHAHSQQTKSDNI